MEGGGGLPETDYSGRSPVKSQLLLLPSTASRFLHFTHFAYPVILLTVFLVAFVVHSINTNSKKYTGDDGKPLLRTTGSDGSTSARKKDTSFTPLQKAAFNWLSIALIATFVGNAASVIVHALVQRPWWCGDATAVSCCSERDAW